MNLRSPISVALFAAVTGIVLRAFLLFAAPYKQVEVPGTLSAYNDEPAHVAYTLHVLKFGTLPHRASPIQESLHSPVPEFENFQSPLYYVLHAAACSVLGVETERGVMMVGRLLSFACMIGVAVVGINLARTVSLTREQLVLVVIFFALGSVFVRFSVQAGNEMMAWLAGGVVTAAYLRTSDTHNHAAALWLAALFLLGVYVKLSLLIFSPFVMHGLFRTWKANRWGVFAVSCLLLLLTLPLFVRNYEVFGSAIPISAGFGAPADLTPSFQTIAFALRSVVFPWSELWQKWVGLALMFPAMALAALHFLGIYRAARVYLWQAALLCVAVLAFLALNTRYHQAEGRYLFIAWPALVTTVAALPAAIQRSWVVVLIFLLPYLLFVL